jgi:hypothetical protein
MKTLRHILPSVLVAGLLLVLASLILWTSLDFQECVKTGERLEKSGTRVVATILAWRHCAGAYALDKNAVITALGTIVIAIFTTILGVFTMRLAQSTRIAADAAKESADAATRSAEALIAVEGARLICQPIHNTFYQEVGTLLDRWPVSPETRPTREVRVRFVLKNFGKTPATIKEVNAVLRQSPNEPDNIFIKAPILELPTEIVIGSELNSSEFKVGLNQFFNLEEATRIENGEVGLWFCGRVVYDDVFDREGTQYFLYKLKTRGSFSRYHDKTEYRNTQNRARPVSPP